MHVKRVFTVLRQSEVLREVEFEEFNNVFTDEIVLWYKSFGVSAVNWFVRE